MKRNYRVLVKEEYNPVWGWIEWEGCWARSERTRPLGGGHNSDGNRWTNAGSRKGSRGLQKHLQLWFSWSQACWAVKVGQESWPGQAEATPLADGDADAGADGDACATAGMLDALGKRWPQPEHLDRQAIQLHKAQMRINQENKLVVALQGYTVKCGFPSCVASHLVSWGPYFSFLWVQTLLLLPHVSKGFVPPGLLPARAWASLGAHLRYWITLVL